MAVSAGDTGPTPRDLALQSAPTTGWARGTASTQGAPGGDWQARTEEAGQWRWPGFRGRGEAVGAKPREESTGLWGARTRRGDRRALHPDA